MKNNVLSAFVIFFAVVACLLIIDDVSYSMQNNDSDTNLVKNSFEEGNNENLATLDLETED